MFNSGNATLSGTATQTGSFPISITATDQFNQNSSPADFTIVISPHGFYQTGSMITARLSHTSTVLSGGKVLITGGQADVNHLLASAELYDPGNGSFSATGNLQASRAMHTATLLSDGRVLLAGGVSSTDSNVVATAELYDANGSTSTATGSLKTARYDHTATLLNNGLVLITGGADGNAVPLASAELFNPATGAFTPTGSMNSSRQFQTATLLTDGKVLVTGGVGGVPPNLKDLDTAELYDPSTGTFSLVNGRMTTPRNNHTATLFPSGPDAGKVLIVGGFNDMSSPSNTAELYDPTSQGFTATANNMASAHASHTEALLNGTVLVVGGFDANQHATAVVEVFDPSTGHFSTTGSLVSARVYHASSTLNDGRVLVTGGTGISVFASAELYK